MAQFRLSATFHLKNGNIMPLIKTPFKRKSNERDSRLFVIACEGSKTEPRYFEAIKTHFKNSRLKIEILNRVDYGINENNSSAKDVIKTLDGFKKRYSFDENDELWLILDRDAANFPEKSLNEIARLAVQKQYFLAVSNPTFELWFVLHFENPSDFTAETTVLYLENKKVSAEKRYLFFLGKYKKCVSLCLEKSNLVFKISFSFLK
jgi:RloB-like protein